MNSACHVVNRILNPRILSYLASHDVARTIYQSLGGGDCAGPVGRVQGGVPHHRHPCLPCSGRGTGAPGGDQLVGGGDPGGVLGNRQGITLVHFSAQRMRGCELTLAAHSLPGLESNYFLDRRIEQTQFPVITWLAPLITGRLTFVGYVGWLQ